MTDGATITGMAAWKEESAVSVLFAWVSRVVAGGAAVELSGPYMS
jgi:hypothetical protein